MSGREFETRPPDISLIFKQMIKLDKMLKKESQAGTKAEQRKNDDGLTSSPACTKPNVVCSQSPSNCKCKNYVLGSVNINKYKRWLLSDPLVEHGLNSFIKF